VAPMMACSGGSRSSLRQWWFIDGGFWFAFIAGMGVMIRCDVVLQGWSGLILVLQG